MGVVVGEKKRYGEFYQVCRPPFCFLSAGKGAIRTGKVVSATSQLEATLSA